LATIYFPVVERHYLAVFGPKIILERNRHLKQVLHNNIGRRRIFVVGGYSHFFSNSEFLHRRAGADVPSKFDVKELRDYLAQQSSVALGPVLNQSTASSGAQRAFDDFEAQKKRYEQNLDVKSSRSKRDEL
jgi:hypothetical protein